MSSSIAGDSGRLGDGGAIQTDGTYQGFQSGPAAVTGYDVIVIAGQSNAAGQGAGPAVDEPGLEAQDSKIVQVGRFGNSNGKLVPGKDPLHHWLLDENWPYKGPGMSFARRYARTMLASGRQVLIVPAAYGGSSIFHWAQAPEPGNPDTILYPDMKARIPLALAQKDARLVAVLWHQGESDIAAHSVPPAPTGYYQLVPSMNAFINRTRGLITALRRDFPSSTCVPFIMGEPVPAWTEPTLPNLPATKAQFKNALIGLAQSLPCTGYVESTGLTSNRQATGIADDIHFSAQAQVHMGTRYFAAYSALKSGG
ncbi:MAG TPA: sialate O-acetylesterase, partial [Bdellovibrionales bacterium]|nr:sialate O-acetylesterase [Bdellovibrionales bacterium]